MTTGSNAHATNYFLFVAVEHRKISMRTESTVRVQILALLKVKRDVDYGTKLHLEHFGKKCTINHWRRSYVFRVHLECFDSNPAESMERRRQRVWIERREARGFRGEPGIDPVVTNRPRGRVGTSAFHQQLRKAQCAPQWKNLLRPRSLFNGMFDHICFICLTGNKLLKYRRLSEDPRSWRRRLTWIRPDRHSGYAINKNASRPGRKQAESLGLSDLSLFFRHKNNKHVPWLLQRL